MKSPIKFNPVDFQQKLLDVYRAKDSAVNFLRTAVQPVQQKDVETACRDLWMVLDNPDPPGVDITDLFALLPNERAQLGIHVITSSTDKTLSTL